MSGIIDKHRVCKPPEGLPLCWLLKAQRQEKKHSHLLHAVRSHCEKGRVVVVAYHPCLRDLLILIEVEGQCQASILLDKPTHTCLQALYAYERAIRATHTCLQALYAYERAIRVGVCAGIRAHVCMCACMLAFVSIPTCAHTCMHGCVKV